MRYHYVWLIWASAFLVPWIVLSLANPGLRGLIWRTSAATALLGLTEPIFVPAYWNPPSLFELAQRTGFDIESVIFVFAIGGIGSALYHALARHRLVRASAEARREPLHQFLGGLLFFGLYAVFMLGLEWFAPGYIADVWNLPALYGGLVYGIPLEELLFGFIFGLYWTGVYEHLTWNESVALVRRNAQGLTAKTSTEAPAN